MKIDKAIIFKIPARIGYHFTYLPSQAIGVINGYLRQSGIEPYSYDIEDVIGTDGAYRLHSKISSESAALMQKYIDRDNHEFDEFFSILSKKINLGGFSLFLISVDPVSAEAALAAIFLSKYIKKYKADSIIILGGEGMIFGYAHEPFKKNILYSLDFIVEGHHIENIAKIIKCVEQGHGLSDIPAITYYDKDAKKITQNPYLEKPQRLDMLDFGNFNLGYYRLRLADFLPKRYVFNPDNTMLLMPFTFIHGCPHVCAFCVEGLHKSMDHLAPKKVVRILGELSSKYDTRYFMFLNNTLNISRDYADELCDCIIQSGLKLTWSDCVNVKNLDRELLFKMRKAGAARLVFGCETGSNRLLEFCQKGFTAEDIKKCLRWSHEAGIWNGVEIITGMPQENEEDIKNTIDFINSNRDIIDEIYVNPFMLYRRSYFFERPGQFGIENIVDSDVDPFQKLRRKRNLILDFDSFRYRFDEKNGKKWNEKMEQALHSYTKTVSSTEARLSPTTEVDLHILLYLYGHFDNKADISKIYKSFLKKTIFSKLFKKDAFLFFSREARRRPYKLSALLFMKILLSQYIAWPFKKQRDL